MKQLLKKHGKKLAFGALCFTMMTLSAQAQTPKAPPASPPMKDSVLLAGKMVSVKYSAPSVKGRDIFGKTGLISRDPNYPVWRAGANSATAFHTDTDLEIEGLKVPKGDYTLFVNLEDPANWELIVNKQTGQWGLTYKKDMDLGRVKMKMTKLGSPLEMLKYTFTPKGSKNAVLTLSWDTFSGQVGVKVQ